MLFELWLIFMIFFLTSIIVEQFRNPQVGSAHPSILIVLVAVLSVTGLFLSRFHGAKGTAINFSYTYVAHFKTTLNLHLEFMLLENKYYLIFKF